MPDTELEAPFRAYKGDQPYIFVSYSHKDSAAVFPELVELHKLGYRIWYDEGIDPGNEWPDAVTDALKRSSVFLVFISPFSVASDNVMDEINYAKKLKKLIFHIHIIETTLPDVLDFRIGSKQAVMKYKMSEENYRRKLEDSLPKSVRDSVTPIAIPEPKLVVLPPVAAPTPVPPKTITPAPVPPPIPPLAPAPIVPAVLNLLQPNPLAAHQPDVLITGIQNFEMGLDVTKYVVALLVMLVFLVMIAMTFNDKKDPWGWLAGVFPICVALFFERCLYYRLRIRGHAKAQTEFYINAQTQKTPPGAQPGALVRFSDAWKAELLRRLPERDLFVDNRNIFVTHLLRQWKDGEATLFGFFRLGEAPQFILADHRQRIAVFRDIPYKAPVTPAGLTAPVPGAF